MNILVFEPFAQREGHFGEYTSQVSQELALLGHSVTVVTTHLNTSRHLSSAPRFEIIERGAKPDTVSTGRTGTFKSAVRGISLILDNVGVLIRLLRIYRKRHFDVVHFFDYEPVSTVIVLSFFSWLFRLRIQTLFVVVHAPDPSFQGHNNLLYNFYGTVSRPMLRRLLSTYATAITAHGTWEKGELEGLLGIQHSRRPVLTVPYGNKVQGKTPSRDEARRALGISYNGTLLLFFGMLRKDKGIEYLLEAAGRIRADCKILIAGMPFDWTAEEIQRMIRGHQCEDRILASLGYIPEEAIPNYFAAADGLIFPYMKHYMGAAGPLKSALGFGKPMIATKVRELSDFLEMAPIGIAVDPENAEALKEGIERFVSLPPSQKKVMAENSRRLAETCSWAVVAKRFSEIYQSFAVPEGGIR